MSTPMDRRVADALHLVADRVLKEGLDDPESLSVELPYFEDNLEQGILTVTARVAYEPHPDILQRKVQMQMDGEERHNRFNKRYVEAMEEQIRREVNAVLSGNADD